jgi:hypothetical protein
MQPVHPLMLMDCLTGASIRLLLVAGPALEGCVLFDTLSPLTMADGAGRCVLAVMTSDDCAAPAALPSSAMPSTASMVTLCAVMRGARSCWIANSLPGSTCTQGKDFG